MKRPTRLAYANKMISYVNIISEFDSKGQNRHNIVIVLSFKHIEGE